MISIDLQYATFVGPEVLPQGFFFFSSPVSPMFPMTLRPFILYVYYVVFFSLCFALGIFGL